MPYQFGGRTITHLTLLNVSVLVRNGSGRQARGAGSMPLGNAWAFPSSQVTHDQSLGAMRVLAERIASITARHPLRAHPIDVSLRLEPLYLEAAAQVSAENRLAEPIPKLCALVVASAFDLAVHDAFGRVNGVDTYHAYGPEFMDRDLSHYLGEDFKGEWLDGYLRSRPAPTLHLYHSVGASDPLDSLDGGPAVEDGLPQTLAEWIAAEGLTHFKVKLNGSDLRLDVSRMADIERVVSAGQRKRRVRDWKYSLDFNEGCRDVDYLLDFLGEIENRAPSVAARLQYVEQPTSRNLAGPPRILLHPAARKVPLVADEALVDLDSFRLAREVGYSGVALKTCKGLSQSLLLAAAAQKYGAYLCVQDLTCPGLSLVHSAGLAARLPGVHALEANSRQYIPNANRRWMTKFPELFRITDGRLGTAGLTGTGLGTGEAMTRSAS
ncbi:MAG: hypothetical protein F4Z21_12025 [Acidobacteria bacterium]|nr:hypothetical protein [Acidobacteriota bacterium]